MSDFWVNPDQAIDGVKQNPEPITELIESTNQLNDSIKILFDQDQSNDEAQTRRYADANHLRNVQTDIVSTNTLTRGRSSVKSIE